MGNGEKASLPAMTFVLRRIVPWFVLFGFIYYIFTMGRTYMNQAPPAETNPLVTTETSSKTSPQSIGQAKVISETLNFRTKPSTKDGEVTQRLQKGTILTVLGTQGKEWLKVQTAQGETGYVFSSNMYVQVTLKKRKK